MKKFIFKILLLILPFALIVGFWEYGLRQVPTNYSVKRDFLESQKNRINTLILGSSHAFHGINPSYFSKPAFNLAYASQPLYYDDALLNIYIDKLPRLKTVLLEMSYFSLEYSVVDVDEDWRTIFYYHAYNIPTERNKLDWDIRKLSLIELYKKDQALKYLFTGFKNPEITMKSNGWDVLGSGGSCTTGQSRARFHTSIMHSANINRNSQYIKNIAEALKKRGVELILVSPPVCNSYFINMSTSKYNADQKIIKSISNTYKIRYLNYMNDSQFTNEDFIDSDHLSKAGAKKFSEILNRNLENIQ